MLAYNKFTRIMPVDSVSTSRTTNERVVAWSTAVLADCHSVEAEVAGHIIVKLLTQTFATQSLVRIPRLMASGEILPGSVTHIIVVCDSGAFHNHDILRWLQSA